MRRWCLIFVVVFGGLATLSASPTLAFDEMYKESVLGLSFTPKLKSLSGQRVSVVGSMAPPLRADGNFFVLTKNPVSLCPFCQSDADWPADILVVYLRPNVDFRQKNRPLVVTGRLELGSYTDPITGFVSLVRIVDAEYTEK